MQKDLPSPKCVMSSLLDHHVARPGDSSPKSVDPSTESLEDTDAVESDMESGSDILSVQESTDFDDDDALVDVDESSVMVLQATQVDDYWLQPSQLTKLCLWDYCARVDKMQISRASKPDSDADSSLDDEDSGSHHRNSGFLI